MSGIFHRVSIRKFLDKPVEKDKVELMLRAAMAAPSARNQQPWEFYVVTNRELIDKLSDAAPHARPAKGSPLLFVPCYRVEEGITSPMYREIDLSASVENLLLEADELGLGAVWLGVAPIQERMDAVRAAIDVPERLCPFAMIACGYADPSEERGQQDRYDEGRVHYIR